MSEQVLNCLRAAVDDLRNLDYDPSQEAWVCGDHGVPECTQGVCVDLPWPKPNTGPTSDFALWADGEFRRVVGPYDRKEVPEMTDEAFRAYSLHDWPLGAALRALPAPTTYGDSLASGCRVSGCECVAGPHGGYTCQECR